MSHWAEEVFRHTDGLAMAPLHPPPELRLSQLTRPYLLSWWAHSDARPALRVRLDSAQPVDFDWGPSLAQVTQQGDLLLAGSEKEVARFAHLKVLGRLGTLLTTLQRAVHLELAVHGPLVLRFAGPVIGDRWLLQEASPSVDSGLLSRALELGRQAEEEEHLTASSAEVASAAEASLRAEWSLTEHSNPKLERHREVLQVHEESGDPSSWMQLFAVHVFLHEPEFQKAWNLKPFLDNVLAEIESHQQAMGGLSLQLAQLLNSQLGVSMGELVYEGKRGRFFRSDICRGGWLQAEDIDLEDQQLAQLGFEPLGDLTCETLVGAAMRVYGCPQQDCWAVVTAGIQHLLIREFYSEYGDDSRLTTTTLPFAETKPEKKMHKVSHPEFEWPELLQAHRSWAQGRGLKPGSHSSNLAEVARSVDLYLVLWG